MKARKAVTVLPVLITLVIGAAVGGLVVVQNQRQSDDVAAAEAIGQDYLSAAATFKVRIAKAIRRADSTKLDEIQRVVETETAKPPKLAPTSAYGRENATAYRDALEVQASLLDPYERLTVTLSDAKVSAAFIAAARKVLELRVTDFVSTTVTDSGSVRSKVIPAFVSARDVFDAQPVPKGQEKLAKTVHDAVQYVVDQATTLANRIDAQKSFSFTYSSQFQAAVDVLNDYATTVEGDVSEAINSAIGAN